MKKFKINVKNRAQLLMLLLVAGVLCCFVVKKEGYHMDELLSFELSNAQYNPWIVPTQPEGRLAKFMREEVQGETFGETVGNLFDIGMDVVKNRGNSKLLQYKADVYPEPVWISGEQFTDYVTVGKGDRFQYFSVYFNVKDDNHPPLHFMLLHTMSSFFPGVTAPFLGDTINILAILGCILCFFRIGSLLETYGFFPSGFGSAAGMGAGALYGISSGGIGTALLIRMYGLVTFFCVMLFYLHVKKWLEGGFEEKNGLLALVTMLGFWTQYFFLFYCLTLAAVTVGLFIVRKRIPELKRYIRTMLLAAVVGVAIFPFALQDVFSSERGVEALQNLGNALSGYGDRLGKFAQILIEGSFGKVGFGLMVLGVLTVCVCVGIVGKKRRLLKGTMSNGGEMGENRECQAFDRGQARELLLMFAVPCVCYFLLAARTAPYLVDRYLMPLFPFAAMGVLLLLGAALGMFCGKGQASMERKRRRACMAGAICLICVVNVAAYDGTYLYQGYDSQLALAKQYGDLSCICLYDGTGYYENLLEFAQYDKTLLLKLPELEQRQDTSDLEQLQSLVVLKKGIVEEDKALAVLEQYGWTVERVLLPKEESVYGDTIYLCRKYEGNKELSYK
ncbi:MAG: hypothetical protein HFH82_03980 [Lachnospiraceae bacterium]|nr:hypothetical protein [Lachnospiraceae bacterium]